ncbi:MAG: malectin domain-containing carbohydrate-binding protein [Lentisphaerota bacterium]
MSLDIVAYRTKLRQWQPLLVVLILTFATRDIYAQSLSADGDQIPDYWEIQHGLNVTQADDYLDLDMDDARNYEEYLAGTDPANPSSIFEVAIGSVTNTASGDISFWGASNRVYQLWYSDELNSGSWSSLVNNLNGAGVPVSLSDTNDTPTRFYRAMAGLPLVLSEPPWVYFGAIPINTTSTPDVIYLTNEDATNHVLMMVELTGAQSNEFSLSNLPAPNYVLAPHQTIQFNLAFTPTNTGTRNTSVKCHLDSHTLHTEVSAQGVGEYAYYVNAGGGSYTDATGQVWMDDAPFFNTGSPYSTTSTISGTTMQPLYRTERWDDATDPEMAYSFAVEPGAYVVRLHFAEIFIGNSTVGSRIFSINIDGQTVLTNYDIVADAGFLHAAVKEFFIETTNTTLLVEFIHNVDNPKISAIEVRSGRLVLDAEQAEWGHVALGEIGVPQQIILHNASADSLVISNLVFRNITGAGHDFEVTIDGVAYFGADTDITHPVNIVLAGGASKVITVRFIPTEELQNNVWLELAGNFPTRRIQLLATGGNSSGHPYLHTVLHVPAMLVDYDTNGFEGVTLDGSDSHTHQFGHALVKFDWATNGTVIATNRVATNALPVGSHAITLTIYDDNVPAEHLTGSSDVLIANPSNVPGPLAFYYEAVPGDGEGSAPAYVEHVPAKASYGERLSSMTVTSQAGFVSSSPYTGTVMVLLSAQLDLAEMDTYGFQIQGGTTNKLLINGTPYAAPLMLMPGRHALEARFAVSTLSDLPLSLAYSAGGGPWTPLTNGLSHDESHLAPIINSAPSEGLDLGGNLVEIRGLGFFPPEQTVVHWGDRTLASNEITVTPELISLVTPASNGFLTVTVETPQGVSDAFTYNYTASGPVPIAFSVTNVAGITTPTQGAWGPDGRLYVANLLGTINAYSFDDHYNVTNTQAITVLESLPNNNILGIGFNPAEAAGPVRIYISHSQLYANGGSCFTGYSPYSGAISVISGPAFNTVETVVRHLPVSNHDHGVNGLQFDNEGNLLIAIGDNSNAGITNCNMGGLPESPLSAAILKAEITKPGFNGTVEYLDRVSGLPSTNQVYGGQAMVAPGVDVSVLAPGLRNPFDLILTTRGLLYAADNGPNNGFGPASTSASTQAADPEQDDTLNLILQDHYYGHPNRNRGLSDARQNVYYNNSQASIPGIFSQGLGEFLPSADGIDEYRSESFNGAMKGNLILQKWNDTTYRVQLTSNGLGIASASPLPAALNSLDVVTGPGGAILGLSYQGNSVVVALPVDIAATGTKALDIFPWRAPATGSVPFVMGGVGFAALSNTTVWIGSHPAALNYVSTNRIRGLIPTNSTPTAAFLDVTVISGGRTSILAKAFRYMLPPSAGSGEWTAGTAMPTTLAEVSAAFIHGLIYVVGDGQPATMAYDPFTQTWINGLAARPYVGSHHACEVIDGKWYLFGGLDAGENKVQIYNPTNDTWTLGANIPWPCGSGASALIGGKVYLAGGIAGSTTVNSNAVYHPASNTWTLLAPMPAGRNHTASGTDGEKFYIFGGRAGGNTVTEGFDDVMIYDPTNNSWSASFDPGSTIPPLPQKRGGMGKAAYFNREFYVMGGETIPGPHGQVVGDVYNRVDVYHPSTKSWRLESPLPTPRHGLFPVVGNDMIYVPGGGETAGYNPSQAMDIFHR